MLFSLEKFDSGSLHPRQKNGKVHAHHWLAGKSSLSEQMNGTCSINISNGLLSLIFYLQMRKRKQRKLIMNSTLSGMR